MDSMRKGVNQVSADALLLAVAGLLERSLTPLSDRDLVEVLRVSGGFGTGREVLEPQVYGIRWRGYLAQVRRVIRQALPDSALAVGGAGVRGAVEDLVEDVVGVAVGFGGAGDHAECAGAVGEAFGV